MIHFTKMHGAGNDYIYVNTLSEVIPQPEKAAIAWSRPHMIVGIKVQMENLYARKRLKTDIFLCCESFLIKIFSDASAGITTHHSFWSIGIKDVHREVSLWCVGRLSDEY